MPAESSGSQALSEAPSSESVISVDWPRCSKAMGELPKAEVGSVRLLWVLMRTVNGIKAYQHVFAQSGTAQGKMRLVLSQEHHEIRSDG
jgi:hypothetical protein